MEFKVRHRLEFIASIIGIFIAFIILDFVGFKGNYLGKLLIFLLIMTFLLVRYYFYKNEGYVIEDDKIYFKNTKNSYIRISKIKCISQEWTTRTMTTRSSRTRYLIIFNSKNSSRYEINFDYRNNKGQSLMTVLENDYGIKVNRVV